MSPDEQEAMLDTMKAASKSTAFEQWLGVAMGRVGAQAEGSSGGGSASAASGGQQVRYGAQQGQQDLAALAVLSAG